MSFGRNPHVAKAEIAEQKALLARDNTAREQAWREAARQWDRAAERENDDARSQSYSDRAQAARNNADAPAGGDGDTNADEAAQAAAKPGLPN